MSSTAQISFDQPMGRETLAGSGNWAFDNGEHALFHPRLSPASRSLVHLVRLALLMAVSSMSSAPDPWFLTQQQRSVSAMSSTFQRSSRRRITPLEARRMALEILRRAEAGRATAAEAEAKQGIEWEEVS